MDLPRLVDRDNYSSAAVRFAAEERQRDEEARKAREERHREEGRQRSASEMPMLEPAAGEAVRLHHAEDVVDEAADEQRSCLGGTFPRALPRLSRLSSSNFLELSLRDRAEFPSAPPRGSISATYSPRAQVKRQEQSSSGSPSAAEESPAYTAWLQEHNNGNPAIELPTLMEMSKSARLRRVAMDALDSCSQTSGDGEQGSLVKDLRSSLAHWPEIKERSSVAVPCAWQQQAWEDCTREYCTRLRRVSSSLQNAGLLPVELSSMVMVYEDESEAETGRPESEPQQISSSTTSSSGSGLPQRCTRPCSCNSFGGAVGDLGSSSSKNSSSSKKSSSRKKSSSSSRRYPSSLHASSLVSGVAALQITEEDEALMDHEYACGSSSSSSSDGSDEDSSGGSSDCGVARRAARPESALCDSVFGTGATGSSVSSPTRHSSHSHSVQRTRAASQQSSSRTSQASAGGAAERGEKVMRLRAEPFDPERLLRRMKRVTNMRRHSDASVAEDQSRNRLTIKVYGDTGVGKSSAVLAAYGLPLVLEHGYASLRQDLPYNGVYLDESDYGGAQDTDVELVETNAVIEAGPYVKRRFSGRNGFCKAPGCTHAHIICFSVVNRASFESVEKVWLPKVRNDSGDGKRMAPPVVVILGTKTDLRTHQRTLDILQAAGKKPVTKEEVETMMKRRWYPDNSWYYVECSHTENRYARKAVEMALKATYQVIKPEAEFAWNMPHETPPSSAAAGSNGVLISMPATFSMSQEQNLREEVRRTRINSMF